MPLKECFFRIELDNIGFIHVSEGKICNQEADDSQNQRDCHAGAERIALVAGAEQPHENDGGYDCSRHGFFAHSEIQRDQADTCGGQRLNEELDAHMQENGPVRFTRKEMIMAVHGQKYEADNNGRDNHRDKDQEKNQQHFRHDQLFARNRVRKHHAYGLGFVFIDNEPAEQHRAEHNEYGPDKKAPYG